MNARHALTMVNVQDDYSLRASSCGFSNIRASGYPGRYVAGLAPGSTLVAGKASFGCGSCLRVTCNPAANPAVSRSVL